MEQFPTVSKQGKIVKDNMPNNLSCKVVFQIAICASLFQITNDYWINLSQSSQKADGIWCCVCMHFKCFKFCNFDKDVEWEQWWRNGEPLSSPQCCPGLISRLCFICGLSLLVLFSALRVFQPPDTPVLPSPQKIAFDWIWFVLISIYIVPN